MKYILEPKRKIYVQHCACCLLQRGKHNFSLCSTLRMLPATERQTQLFFMFNTAHVACYREANTTFLYVQHCACCLLQRGKHNFSLCSTLRMLPATERQTQLFFMFNTAHVACYREANTTFLYVQHCACCLLQRGKHNFSLCSTLRMLTATERQTQLYVQHCAC